MTTSDSEGTISPISRLRTVARQVRRSLFAGPDDDQRLMTEGGRVDTSRLDVDDETVVHRLLDVEGGRIRQGSVIEQTNWSSAKVSRLLTTMENQNEIERVRIGREKIVVACDETDDD